MPKKTNWEIRVCDICKVERPKISGTHNTDKCRFKSKVTTDENKSVKNYFDTGASQHFFKTMPKKPKIYQA